MWTNTRLLWHRHMKTKVQTSTVKLTNITIPHILIRKQQFASFGPQILIIFRWCQFNMAESKTLT